MGPTATVAPITSVSPENHQITMEQPPKIDVSGVNVYYGAHRVLHDISLRIAPNQVPLSSALRAAASPPSCVR